MGDQEETVNSDLLNAIINLDAPQQVLFSFGPDPVDIEQNSPLLELSEKILLNIVGRIPIQDRLISLGPVCRRFHEVVKSSVKSVHFFTDQLDLLPDKNLKYFMSLYGGGIEKLNFDLFKSSLDCTQWAWRQSVITTVNFCKNLRELNILVCTRHRLRDIDLKMIFKEAPLLESLSIDAKYINGHCFQDLPVHMKKLELEMCYRMTPQSLQLLFRLKNLKVLYFSQLLCVKDSFFIQLPRHFKKLEDFSLISHQDTVYKQLSAAGLAHLAKLPALVSLSLEGLAAVTDRLLQNLATGSSKETIKTLSLAFCYNFGSSGVGALANLECLENLNLDGVSKRDISSGLDKIADNGKLVRLMIAEKSNISVQSVMALVEKNSTLRFLDISNNESALNWHSANFMVDAWAKKRNPPLVIFTDDHLAWNYVPKVQPYDNSKFPVTVIHINRSLIPAGEVLPDCILSELGTGDIAPGLNCSRLRRGNFYRLLFEMVEMSSFDFDQADEGARVGDASKPQSDVYADINMNKLADIHIQSENSMELGQDVERPPFSNITNSPSSINYGDINAHDRKFLFNPVHLLSDSTPISLPLNFSFSPVSASGDPHTQDWSLDAMQYLVGTSAFSDGARVGPMDVHEGIVFKPDGLVGCDDYVPSDTSADHLSTLASGGAPRPPVEIPEVPDYAYSRRRKRRSVPNKRFARKPEFNLSQNDFPPLS